MGQKSIKEAYFNSFPEIRRRATRSEKKEFNESEVYELGIEKQKQKWNNEDILTFSGKGEYLNAKYNLLLRDMFGLSSDETWHSYGTQISKYHAELNNKSGQLEEVDKKSKNHIDRFKSPILFKPLRQSNGDYKVYIIVEEPDNAIRNTFFLVKDKYKKRGLKDLFLRTPKKEEFSMVSFFNYITDRSQFNFSAHVDGRYKGYKDSQGLNYFETLKKIFDDLQNPTK